MVNQVSGVSSEPKIIEVTAASTSKKAQPSSLHNLPESEPQSTSMLETPDVTLTLNGKEQLVQDKNAQQDKKEKKEFTKEDVQEMSAELTKFMNKLNCNLEFSYYEKLGQIGVKMIDKKTQEVIKEFPPEKILEAMIKTKEWIGVFLDKKV